ESMNSRPSDLASNLPMVVLPAPMGPIRKTLSACIMPELPAQPSASAQLAENGRGDEDQQFGLGLGVLATLEQPAQVGQIAQQRGLGHRGGEFLPEHAAQHH